MGRRAKIAIGSSMFLGGLALAAACQHWPIVSGTTILDLNPAADRDGSSAIRILNVSVDAARVEFEPQCGCTTIKKAVIQLPGLSSELIPLTVDLRSAKPNVTAIPITVWIVRGELRVPSVVSVRLPDRRER